MGQNRHDDESDPDLQGDEDAQVRRVRADLGHSAGADRPGRPQGQDQAAERDDDGCGDGGQERLQELQLDELTAPVPGGPHGDQRDDHGQVDARSPQGRGGQQPQQRHGGNGIGHHDVRREKAARSHCEAGAGQPRQRPYEHGRNPSGLQQDQPERCRDPAGGQRIMKASDASGAHDDGDQGDDSDQSRHGEGCTAHQGESRIRPPRTAVPPALHARHAPPAMLKVTEDDERRQRSEPQYRRPHA